MSVYCRIRAAAVPIERLPFHVGDDNRLRSGVAHCARDAERIMVAVCCLRARFRR